MAFGVAQDFYDFFDAHPDGVYDIPGDPDKLDGHCVAIIGWGVTKDGTKYWLVRNSWGGKWADQGCFRIKKESIYVVLKSDVWGAHPDIDWVKYRENLLIQDHKKFLAEHKNKNHNK